MDSSTRHGLALSVVIATRDRPHLLDDCLDACERALGPDDEIVVVDSASTSPATAELVGRRRARLVRCKVPGASLARNAGWRAALSPLVAFVDDDVRVAPGWAEAWRRAFGADGDLGFATGRLTAPPDGDLGLRPVAVFDEPEAAEIGPWSVGGFGHGANMAVRRADLEAVGGFDETLGPGTRWYAGEDLNLFDRLVAAGSRGRYVPSAEAWHMQWRTRRQLMTLEWRYGVGQGARLVKLRRIDPARARPLVRVTQWDEGVKAVLAAARRGWKFTTASTALRMVGTAVGAVSCATRSRPQPGTG
ncbi:MAG TPA: glycosyltransferase [Acidimicrobiales bacterium]|nr:glycosyltransferase [Acidimicrobiales bacterium]